jgi:hypothetical protein
MYKFPLDVHLARARPGACALIRAPGAGQPRRTGPGTGLSPLGGDRLALNFESTVFGLRLDD